MSLLLSFQLEDAHYPIDLLPGRPKATAMDDLTSKVGNIETTLHGSHKQLQTLDKNAQTSIGGEVRGIRNALTNGEGKIQHVSSEMRPFLRQIRCSDPDTSPIDLKPQMAWLSTNLGKIVSELETAQSRADAAIKYTNDYTYKVMDVGQEVEVNRCKLTEAQQDGEALASQAQSELSVSETLLAATQSKIATKESEIRTKTNEANAKRERKKKLDSEISDKNWKIYNAEQKAKRKKGDALFGAVSSSCDNTS